MGTLFRIVLFIAAFLSISQVHAYSNENGETQWQPTGYKPNYFLLGDPDAKLSLSFKVKLMDDNDLYLGYSQLMFWEIAKESAPFKDLNYNPEIFYRTYPDGNKSSWLDIGIYEHESNGQSGADSRGWNRFYLLYASAIQEADSSQFSWSLKAWAPYAVEANNRDIKNYRGLWELNLTLSSFLGAYFSRDDLTLRLYPGGRNGTDPTKGGQELTLRLKGAVLKSFLPVLTFQYFNGYGEGLLDYNKSQSEFRVGIGF